MNRRGFLKLTGQVGVLATLPTSLAVATSTPTPIDWGKYTLEMMTPVYDRSFMSWHCGGKLKKSVGSGFTKDVRIFFALDEEEAEKNGGMVEYAEHLIRKHIEDPEWQRKWLS